MVRSEGFQRALAGAGLSCSPRTGDGRRPRAPLLAAVERQGGRGDSIRRPASPRTMGEFSGGHNVTLQDRLETVGGAFHALYRFSRPHTMLGTLVSVCSVSLMALVRVLDGWFIRACVQARWSG